MKKLALSLALLIPFFLYVASAAALSRAEDYTVVLNRVHQAVAERDFLRAEAVLAWLLDQYGEKADLLAARGRVLFWQKRYVEALESLRRARELQPSPELDQELMQVETARVLCDADQFIAGGDLMQAGTLLSRSFQGGCDRYQTGLRLAAVRNRQGRHREAAQVYRLLMREYPRDPELPLLYAEALSSMGEKEKALQVTDRLARRSDDPRAFVVRGRILFEQGRLLEAREAYETARHLGGTPELATRRKEVEDALRLRHLQWLVAGGEYELARPLLKSMSAPGPYSREARLLSGRVLLDEGRLDAALTEGGALYRDYPKDPEVLALYVEALGENGLGAEAERVLYGVGGRSGETLRGDREALLYRAKGNWLRLTGELYGFSDRSGTESGAGVTVSQRVSKVTAVASVAEVTRFGLTDPRIALDLYAPHGDRGNLSGAVYLSVAPASSFLPRYTAGGEVGVAIRPVELLAGYSRVEFREDPVDLLSAAVEWYLPTAPVSLAERAFFATRRGSSLWVTTVSWDPSHRCRVFLSAGGGTASERRIASEDLERHDTWLVRGGGEYRFTSTYSVGAEGSFESRRNLYDRYGGAVYLRYWWP